MRTKLCFGGVGERSGLREALLDTNPATAFNPFLGFSGRNSKPAISRVYVTQHQSGEFELPLRLFHCQRRSVQSPGRACFLCNRVRIPWRAVEERSPVWSATFDKGVGFTNLEASQVNRDVWATYQEVRFPVTSPLWNFLAFTASSSILPSARNGTAKTLLRFCRSRGLPFVPAQHSQYDAQKPKFSVRWQPLDPKWIGALTLRGTYSEAFHAPTLPDLTPAGTVHAAQRHGSGSKRTNSPQTRFQSS